MDKELIEKYKKEMIEMKNRALKNSNIIKTQGPLLNENQNNLGNNGGILGEVTIIRGLYPLPNAKFTIFTGTVDNMDIISEGFTDTSGRTSLFPLNAPRKDISLNQNSTQTPYNLYNVKISADGYLDNIHLNIPVFSGVVSLIKSNMLLIETAGVNKNSQIFDELPNYNL